MFWDISKAMLECEDEKKNAEEIDRFLRRLLALSSQDLRAGLALKPPDWNLLREFYQVLDK
jgi:hypothetical protein